jgi:hypothetical protein
MMGPAAFRGQEAGPGPEQSIPDYEFLKSSRDITSFCISFVPS